MIYEAYLDGRILYYPGDSIYTLRNPRLETELNKAGSFEFEIPITNPEYNNMKNRVSMVQVLRDGKEIFCGEVRESEELEKGLKTVYVVGELAFLYDSIQPQGKYQNITPENFFEALLSYHNNHVEEKKQFLPGIVTVKDSNDSIYRYTNREDTLTAIRDKLCDSLSGYLRIRKVDGKRYLDLVTLEDYGIHCNQPIQFGSNLLHYAKNLSGSDIVTALIPLGAMLEESPIVGLEAYTDITSVNDGEDYVCIPKAVEEFGYIWAVKKWDDVTVPANLKTKGETWLKSNQYEIMILELKAIDLSALNANLEPYAVGDYVHALAEPYGMDVWLPLQKKTTYLANMLNNSVTLGYTAKGRYTDQTNALTTQYQQVYSGATSTAVQALNVAEQANSTSQTVENELIKLQGNYVSLAAFEAYKQELDQKITTVYKFSGSVDTYESLPESPAVGDVYNVQEDGMNYAWTEDGWDSLGSVVELSGYVKMDDLPMTAEQYQDILSRLETLEGGIE